MMNKKAFASSQLIIILVLVGLVGWFVWASHVRSQATRQILEQEKFLRAVRTEQLSRCNAGGTYAMNTGALSAFKKADNQLTYDLSSGTGITATHSKYGYELTMPSYDDGRLCCEKCEKVNKRYSPCARLEKRSNFLPAANECIDPASPAFNPAVAEVRARKQQGAAAQAQQAQEAATPENAPQPADNNPQEQPAAPATQEAPDATVATQASTATVTTQASTQTATSEPAAQPAPEEAVAPEATPCEMDPEKGAVYMQECATLLNGTFGTATFTWNQETCKYEVEHTCMWPTQWKKLGAEKQVKKGVYPTDIDGLCEQVLKNQGCPEGVAAGRRCSVAKSVCYSQCTVADKSAVEEGMNMVFYDVTLQLQKLRCTPSSKATLPQL